MNLILFLLLTWEGIGEGGEGKGEGWEDDSRPQQADEIATENYAKLIAEFEQA